MKRKSLWGIAIALLLLAAGALPLLAQVNVTNFDNIRTDGFVRVDGYARVGTFLRVDPATAITVTSGGTVTPRGSYQPLTSAGNVGTSSITAGNAGDVLFLINTANTTITFTDTGTLKLGGNRALGQFDTLTLVSDGTNWIERAFANN
jgi:hypothetical protein